MKLLLIDAYDSFVYVIYQYLCTGGHDVTVLRHDRVTTDTLAQGGFEAVVLGPGPGHPGAAGYLALLQAFAQHLPFFGVCLGMQAIALYYGADVVPASHLMHGKTSQIGHDNSGCFANLPNPLTVTRYHSLIATEATLAATPLLINATAKDDGYVMAVRHPELPIAGVQFHPESVATEKGMQIFDNYFNTIASISRQHVPQ